MDERGYQVLSGATDQEAIDAYASERASAGDGLLVREPSAEHVELMTRAAPDAGAVDPYAILDAARRVLLPPAVTDALHAEYGEAPLLFDAAETAAAAPEAGPYRDATYTALADDPDTLVTLVVALGEAAVAVWPGSQAIATAPFSGRYRHFNPERDGTEAIERHRAELTAALDGDPETIALAPGDALLLAAGTVHRAPDGPALVAHLAPARVRPGYFAYRPERARHASVDDGRAFLASQHYDLVDALAPEDPPTQEEELARVEEALREHDAENAAPPQAPTQQPGAARRSGGLVDSVRGILGRRNRG
jgi:hypothetical protein